MVERLDVRISPSQKNLDALSQTRNAAVHLAVSKAQRLAENSLFDGRFLKGLSDGKGA